MILVAGGAGGRVIVKFRRRSREQRSYSGAGKRAEDAVHIPAAEGLDGAREST